MESRNVPEVPPDAHPVIDLPDLEGALLAHLTTVVIQRQLKPIRSYNRVAAALLGIADDGMVELVGTASDVWVRICGEVIVHCARDWLAWQASLIERGSARN